MPFAKTEKDRLFNQPEKEIELIALKCRLLFDNARDIILFINHNGRILDANPAAVATYGYSHRELTSMTILDIRADKNPEFVRAQMKKASEEPILFETTHQTRDGRLIPVEVSSTGVDFFGERLLMSIIRDVSTKREYLATIERLAFYDELTGIPNRKHFRDDIRSRIERGGKPFALMILDVDHFKDVNDLYDHSVGDGLLLAITKSVGQAVEGRATLYRLGGDEFTLIMDDTEERDRAGELARLVCRAADATFTVQGNAIHTSVSVGISRYPADARDETLLLKRADLAMYRAKRGGRNDFAFYD